MTPDEIKLGLAEVPVVLLDHLNEARRDAYVIADKKIAINAGWDEVLPAQELRDTQLGGIDLATIGFSADELEALLAEPESPEAGAAEERVQTSPAGGIHRLVFRCGREHRCDSR